MSRMPNVQLRRYLPGDHLSINLQESQRQDSRTDYMIDANLKAGRSLTLLVNGKVKAVGGVAIFWRGRGAAWAFVDQDIPPRAWPRIRRLVRLELDAAQKNLARLEVQTRRRSIGHWTFARSLGFEAESVLHNFVGNDVYIMGVR